MHVGLDVGRRFVKVYNGSKMFKFSSIVGEWRDRKLRTDYGEDSIEGMFRGERFFAGDLADNESEFARSMMTDDKAHGDTLLLALIALHKAGMNECIVVTGLPVKNHTDGNKEAMRRLLLGDHEIQVNGIVRRIRIKRVEVAVEGGGAFWSNPQDGLIRLLDGGSKTINAITMKDRRYNDMASWTLIDKDGNTFGFETSKSQEHQQLINRIAADVSRKWGNEDIVLCSGGAGEKITELIKPYFPNARTIANPTYANAIGFWKIGRSIIHDN